MSDKKGEFDRISKAMIKLKLREFFLLAITEKHSNSTLGILDFNRNSIVLARLVTIEYS